MVSAHFNDFTFKHFFSFLVILGLLGMIYVCYFVSNFFRGGFQKLEPCWSGSRFRFFFNFPKSLSLLMAAI